MILLSLFTNAFSFAGVLPIMVLVRMYFRVFGLLYVGNDEDSIYDNSLKFYLQQVFHHFFVGT